MCGVLSLAVSPTFASAEGDGRASRETPRPEADAPVMDFDLAAWLDGQRRILGVIAENTAIVQAHPGGFERTAGEMARDADLVRDNMERALAAAREAEAARGAVRRDFNALDFGAVGDGVADDGPAIRRAIAAAIKTPWSRVILPPGRYLIAGADPRRITLPQYAESRIDGSIQEKDIRAPAAHLVIAGARNLVLTGSGRGETEIILGENSIAGIQVSDSLHTFVRDLSIDHAKLPFSQGRVTGAPDGTSLEFEVDPGFPEPTAKHLATNFQVIRLFQESAEFGVKLHERASTYYMVDTVRQAGPGLFRVEFKRPLPEPDRDATLLSPGERIVFYGRWRQLYSPLKFSTSRNCGASGVDIHTSPSVAINPEMNDLIVLDDVRVTPGPGRIASSNADGVFATANRIGPWILGCTIRQAGDDYFNLLGVTAPVWEAAPGEIWINRSKNQVLGTFRSGDRLLLVEGRDYRTRWELTVKSSALLKKDGQLFAVVRVDGLEPEHVRTELNVNAKEGEIPDYLVNLNAQNPGALVQNNAFLNGFRLVLRSSGALVERNRIVTRFGRGTTFDFGVRRYGHGGESWAADNILVRGNVFDMASSWAPFKCPFRADSRVMNHGVVIEGNDFVSPHLKTDAELRDGFDPELSENIRIGGNRFHSSVEGGGR